MHIKKPRRKKALYQILDFQQAEWEYAARGGLQGAMYPWGGPYTKNDRVAYG